SNPHRGIKSADRVLVTVELARRVLANIEARQRHELDELGDPHARGLVAGGGCSRVRDAPRRRARTSRAAFSVMRVGARGRAYRTEHPALLRRWSLALRRVLSGDPLALGNTH